MFGLNPIHLIILFGLGLFFVVPAIGIFQIARRVGFSDGVSVLWAVALLIPGGLLLVPLGLGFVSWPRDAVAAQPVPQGVQQPPASS